MKKLLTIVGLTAVTLAAANAQITTFQITGLSGVTTSVNGTATGLSATPVLSRTGLTANSGSNVFASTANLFSQNTPDFSQRYVGFSVAPSAGNVLFASGLTFGVSGSNTAPNQFGAAYSTNNFTTSNSTTGSVTASAVNQTFAFNLITNDTLSVRIQNYGTTSVNNGTAVTGGSFRITANTTVTGSTLNATTGAIALTGATEIRNSGALSLGGNITGAFGITKTGNGTLTLTGSSASTTTTISAGTLEAGHASALGTGTVAVSGGTLASTVTNVNAGNVNLNSGAFSLNGASTGAITLSTGADVNFTGGTWNLSIASLASFDNIIGGGAASEFNISGTTLALSGTIANGTYNILTGFTSGTGTFSSFTGLVGQTASTSIDGGILTLTVIPEPHEYAIMVTAMLGLLIVMRLTRRNGRRS